MLKRENSLGLVRKYVLKSPNITRQEFEKQWQPEIFQVIWTLPTYENTVISSKGPTIQPKANVSRQGEFSDIFVP